MNHYFSDVEPLGNAYFGEGTGSIYFSNLNCNGSEERIVDCSSISPHSCHHSEDAGVRCGGECIIHYYVGTVGVIKHLQSVVRPLKGNGRPVFFPYLFRTFP